MASWHQGHVAEELLIGSQEGEGGLEQDSTLRNISPVACFLRQGLISKSFYYLQ